MNQLISFLKNKPKYIYKLIIKPIINKYYIIIYIKKL